MTNVAKNLKHLRERSGLTQEQLSKKLNVTHQTVSSWETGRTEPDTATLAALSDVFGVTVEELITGRKSKGYQRFQKKYRVSLLISLLFALAIFLLSLTVGADMEEQINQSYSGKELHFFLFRLVFPPVAYACLGVAAVSCTALFYRICLYGRRKQLAFLAGLAALPSLAVMLDSLVAILASGYKAPLTCFLFVSTLQWPPVQILLFALLPALSGVLLFAGSDKETEREDR